MRLLRLIACSQPKKDLLNGCVRVCAFVRKTTCRWSLGVEGRQAESNVIGRRLTASSTPRELSGVKTPLEPQERFMGQQALHMVAFADWEGIMALDPPPETADYPVAVHHFARRWVLTSLWSFFFL